MYLLLNEKPDESTYCLLVLNVVIVVLEDTECFIMVYRYTRHKCSLNNSKYRLKTTLFKYIWDLNDINKDLSINCEVLARRERKFNLQHGCTICIMKKHEISKLNSNLALNKRGELFSNC